MVVSLSVSLNSHKMFGLYDIICLATPVFGFSDSAEIPQVGQLMGYAQTAQRPVAALLDFNFWGS